MQLETSNTFENINRQSR